MKRPMWLAFFGMLALVACGDVQDVEPIQYPTEIDGRTVVEVHSRSCPTVGSLSDDYWLDVLLDAVEPTFTDMGVTDLDMDSAKAEMWSDPTDRRIHLSIAEQYGPKPPPGCSMVWGIAVIPVEGGCAQLEGLNGALC